MNENATLDCEYTKTHMVMTVGGHEMKATHEDFERFCAWYLGKRLKEKDK